MAEIPIDGMAPVIASAIFDVTSACIQEIPFTSERVWRGVEKQQTYDKGEEQ